MGWYRPNTLEEALRILDDKHPKIVCGGTDLFVNWPERQSQSKVQDWLDVQRIPELNNIIVENDEIVIGAAKTAADIWQNRELNGLTALCESAKVVGGWQIQNRASIGGNIANASPAADMVVPLVAYHAKVNVASQSGNRSVLVSEFITGPKSTQLRDNEIIVSVTIPKEVLGLSQTFLRHDQRGGTDISLVSVAAVVKGTKNAVESLDIAVGAANATPVILEDIGTFAVGELTDEKIAEIGERYAQNCQPVTDVRASAEYRLAMVKVFIKRALDKIVAKETEV